MMYKILRRTSLVDLELLVEEFLSKGWVLQGGVSVQGTYVYQAVSKG